MKDIRPPTQQNKWPIRPETSSKSRPETIEEQGEESAASSLAAGSQEPGPPVPALFKPAPPSAARSLWGRTTGLGVPKKPTSAELTPPSTAGASLSLASPSKPMPSLAHSLTPSVTPAQTPTSGAPGGQPLPSIQIQPKSITSPDYQSMIATLVDMRVDLKMEIQKINSKIGEMQEKLIEFSRHPPSQLPPTTAGPGPSGLSPSPSTSKARSPGAHRKHSHSHTATSGGGLAGATLGTDQKAGKIVAQEKVRESLLEREKSQDQTTDRTDRTDRTDAGTATDEDQDQTSKL